MALGSAAPSAGQQFRGAHPYRRSRQRTRQPEGPRPLQAHPLRRRGATDRRRRPVPRKHRAQRGINHVIPQICPCVVRDHRETNPVRQDVSMTQIAIVVYPRFTALDLVGPTRCCADSRRRHPFRRARAGAGSRRFRCAGDWRYACLRRDLLTLCSSPAVRAARRPPATRGCSAGCTVSPGADWTASVCTGSVVLAAAGLLEGRRDDALVVAAAAAHVRRGRRR